jgi:hypothetical protein
MAAGMRCGLRKHYQENALVTSTKVSEALPRDEWNQITVH